MSFLTLINFKQSKWLHALLIVPVLGLSACAGIDTTATTASQQVAAKPQTQVVVFGGDQILQNWTTHAVQGYCQNKHWPKDILKSNHLPKANHPMFNQPRKTQVLVSSGNTLHIHFQLGGVLMDNYSHELIIHPPTAALCQRQPVRYEVTMQPDGDAVIYISRPQAS